jgi:hypothetical protein
MDDKPNAEERSAQERQNEYMRGGKGRKDEVGGSGIYPASVPDAPSDAVVRTEGELVGHSEPRRKPTNERSDKSDETAGSE